MSKKTETSTPMDDSVIERPQGEAKTNRSRNAHGLAVLIKEVLDLFPETPYETSGMDGRNTALDVSFDFTGLDSQDRVDAISLLLVLTDDRIRAVDAEDGLVLVQFHSNPRIQDSREPFGLDDAWIVLTEGDSA